MRKTFLYILPLLLLAAAGCEETIDIELEDQEPLLVLNAQLSSDRMQHTVFLSMSTVSMVASVKGATVEVSVNGGAAIKAVETATQTEDGYVRNYTAYAFSAPLAPGDKVRISATKGERQAHTEITMPPRVNLASVDTSRVFQRSYDTYTEEQFQFKVDFQDPAGENFYRFHCVLESDMVFNLKEGEPIVQHIYANLPLDTSNDPVISEGLTTGNDSDLSFFNVDNVYAVFSDELFSENRRTFRFSISPYQLQSNIWFYASDDLDWENVESMNNIHRRLGIILYTMDYLSFRYLKSLNNMETFGYEQQILIEPTTLPSNVDGGTGFVGAYTASDVIWFDLQDVYSTNDPEYTDDPSQEGSDNESYTFEN